MTDRTKTLIGAVVVAVLASVVLTAQRSVAITLRNGERLNAHFVDLKSDGFEVEVNGANRVIPKNQVAMVDFGSNVTVQQSWFNGMTSLDHLLVFRNGDTLLTELVDVGGTEPMIFRFKTKNGEREISGAEVARIYLVAPAGANMSGTATGGVQGDGSVAVNAADPWTSTGLNVRSGEFLRFSVSREIRVGPGANDTATADGNPNINTNTTLFRRLPVTSLPVGGLIGKVGNGRAFSIGSAPQPVRMPASGTLFLGINDLTFTDNSGFFRVVVTR